MSKRKGLNIEDEDDVPSRGEVDLHSQVEELVILARQSSQDAEENIDDLASRLLQGLTIGQISSELPKVKNIEMLFDQANELAKEVVLAANSQRGACIGTFFSESAMNTMGPNGVIPALLTIPESSTWGKSAILLLELLDPFKNTIRTVFKPKMVEGFQAMYRQNQYCLMCIWPREKLMVCTRCKEARYCSKECQKNDWTRHKNQDCIVKI